MEGKREGCAKSNEPPVSDYRHGAALDVHRGARQENGFL